MKKLLLFAVGACLALGAHAQQTTTVAGQVNTGTPSYSNSQNNTIIAKLATISWVPAGP